MIYYDTDGNLVETTSGVQSIEVLEAKLVAISNPD
jgi:hypothetical protein